MFKGENIMHFIKTSLRCFQVTLFAAVVSASASAASQCKGMEQDACGAMAECAWVNAYVRKDGRSVSGHCKKKARGKPADQAASGAIKLSHAK
jgi:hypothetical protein